MSGNDGNGRNNLVDKNYWETFPGGKLILLIAAPTVYWKDWECIDKVKQLAEKWLKELGNKCLISTIILAEFAVIDFACQKGKKQDYNPELPSGYRGWNVICEIDRCHQSSANHGL